MEESKIVMEANELSCKELMIGDWVKLGKRKLRCKNILGHTNDVMFENGVITNVMNIEPIPLTPEILENNGFEKQQFGNFIYENDDVNLRIEFYPKNINYTNGCYDYIDIEKGCVTITEMPIEFVHELQRVLRILETNRDIVL